MRAFDQILLLIEQNCWQDVVLSAGNIFFCFTLIPMLRHPGRPPPSDMYTDRPRLACWRICLRHPASVGHSANPGDNRAPVACYGVQRNLVRAPHIVRRGRGSGIGMIASAP